MRLTCYVSPNDANKGTKLKSLLTVLFALSLSTAAFSQDMNGATISATRPVDVDVSFTPNTFETTPWTKEFRYVIVVNKATTGKDAQTIQVYEYGQLIRKEKISTGRDAFEKAGMNHSKRDSWTVTPTGYYTPDFLSRDHKSSAYGGKFSW